MGEIPKIACNRRCNGCPALPLTREQYQNVLQGLLQDSEVRSDSQGESKLLFQQFLNMEVLAVFCLQRQEVCFFKVKK